MKLNTLLIVIAVAGVVSTASFSSLVEQAPEHHEITTEEYGEQCNSAAQAQRAKYFKRLCESRGL